MISDIEKLRAHALAVEALIENNNTMVTAMEAARATMIQYNKTAFRDMALQGLARSVVRMQEAGSSLTPYLRTLKLYVSECEKV